MRGLLVALIGGLGIGAFWRRLRRRRAQEIASDPAAELRRRLAETRETGEESNAAGTGEPMGEGEAGAAPDLAGRRQAVHERAHGLIDELG